MKYFVLIFITSVSFIEASQESEPKYFYVEPVAVEKVVFKNIQKTEEVVVVKEREEIPFEIPDEEIIDNNITQEIEEVIIPDEDGDGVLDEDDICPNTPEGFHVTPDGCPKKATLKVNFPPDRYTIVPKMVDKLESFAEFLIQNEHYQVVIYGYTDSIGEADENKRLSQKRADSVKNALIELGVSSTKLTAIGRGEEYPVASNMYRTGREKNRRIEAELIY